MAKCRACRWYKTDIGNPTQGLCITVTESNVDSSTSGTASSVITGNIVNGSDEQCNNFEDKSNTSRSQRLKEGM